MPLSVIDRAVPLLRGLRVVIPRGLRCVGRAVEGVLVWGSTCARLPLHVGRRVGCLPAIVGVRLAATGPAAHAADAGGSARVSRGAPRRRGHLVTLCLVRAGRRARTPAVLGLRGRAVLRTILAIGWRGSVPAGTWDFGQIRLGSRRR